jgi:hypothetical protein
VLNNLLEVQQCPDIHRGFALGKLRRCCPIKNRMMNGASQQKPNQGTNAGNKIKEFEEIASPPSADRKKTINWLSSQP